MSAGPKFRAALHKRAQRRRESSRLNPVFLVCRWLGMRRPWEEKKQKGGEKR
jgi:hypothetical protein